MTLKYLNYYINLYKEENLEDYNILSKIKVKTEKMRYIELSKKIINYRIDQERELQARKDLRKRIERLDMNVDVLIHNYKKENANKPRTNRNTVKSLTNSKSRNFKNKEV